VQPRCVIVKPVGVGAMRGEIERTLLEARVFRPQILMFGHQTLTFRVDVIRHARQSTAAVQPQLLIL